MLPGKGVDGEVVVGAVLREGDSGMQTLKLQLLGEENCVMPVKFQNQGSSDQWFYREKHAQMKSNYVNG